jgi:hypothetical protein
MAMDEEARRLHIQLFTHVFADQRQILTALVAGAGFRFVVVLDARKMRRQRLPVETIDKPTHAGLRTHVVSASFP